MGTPGSRRTALGQKKSVNSANPPAGSKTSLTECPTQVEKPKLAQPLCLHRERRAQAPLFHVRYEISGLALCRGNEAAFIRLPLSRNDAIETNNWLTHAPQPMKQHAFKN